MATRRTLLHATYAAPVAAALLGVPAEAAASNGRFDGESPRFAIAVLPDTQYLFDEDRADPAPLRRTFCYLIEERAAENIAFMTHLGDVTEHGTAQEVGLADQTFRVIDGKVPYSVLAGNHDINGSTDDQRGDSPYLTAFGPHRFRRSPTFGGASPDGYNSFHVLDAGGRQWLVLALDWRVSKKGLAWAQSVIDGHRKLPVILTTHEIAWADDNGTAQLSGNGTALWDGLIRRNDQIFLTLNGHFWPPGRTVLRNDAGHDVHVHLANYQDRYYGGAGMIRLYSFDLARDVIDVSTFSPWFLQQKPESRSPLAAETLELSGPVDRFTVQIDFDRRFAGFAPKVLPAPRPPRAVMPRGTVAYWRFDSAGFRATPGPVADGTVARDLSGNGNDLVTQRLVGSAQDVLTWSAEHHDNQPAHASLLFGGGKSPSRGALLRTRADAPINRLTFESGYTIEAFVKLPQPFQGDHAWMGILSWEGRSGDAGKASGDPLEPTCSLNVTSEWFLQYVVYPQRRDACPTSWSHALIPGRWTHIAVVNDARRTVVYVDGSKITRNPAQQSRGITTLGKPFVLGGTAYDESYSQSFYGWIGDTRIVARPLAVADFLLTPPRG